MDLGQRVRELRKEQRFSQTELAIRAGVARNTLNRIENGHLMPTARVIEQLAEALDVAPGVLFEEPALPLGEASETGRLIKRPVADAVGVSDKVTPTLIDELAQVVDAWRAGDMSRAEAEQKAKELVAA
jgi:transcriptional regulator with XRE-family HTH domain